MKRAKKSFTLIELLIVLSILAIISTLIFINVSSAQKKARDTQRVSDLEALNNAILMHYQATGHYPDLPDGCGIDGINGVSSNEVGTEVTENCYKSEFIKNLTPAYISKLPTDPKPELFGVGGSGFCPSCNSRGFLYFHYNCEEDPVNCPGRTVECYKILISQPENAKSQKYKKIWDPRRDGGANTAEGRATIDGNQPTAWSEYSRGCAAR